MSHRTELELDILGNAKTFGSSSLCEKQVAKDVNPALFPLVTIGLPVFNGADTLAAALKSLVNQDYQNIQIIISDNASIDATLAICEEFACRDSRIHIIKKQKNEGAVANFRTVLNAAEAEYFMWAAADDYWDKQFISRLLPELQAVPSSGVAMCAVDRVYPDGTPFDQIRFTGKLNPNKMGHLKLLNAILSGAKYNMFIYGLFRTQYLKRAMINFPNVFGGDRMFICQIALACNFAYLDEVLLKRTHQPRHVEAHLNIMSKKGILRRQLLSFSSMILRSKIIPWWRKIYTPLALFKYFNFGLRQKNTRKFGMIKRFLKKLFISPGQILKIMTVLSALIGLCAALVYLDLISTEIAIFASLTIILFFSTGLLNRHWIKMSQKHIQNKIDVSQKNTQSQLVEKFEETQEYTESIMHNQEYIRTKVDENQKYTWTKLAETQENVQSKLSKEIRYLTDVVLHPELKIEQAIKDVPLSHHLYSRLEKHRKVLEFVRNLEESQIREVYLAELFPGIESTSIPIGVVNEQTGHANKTDMLYVSAIAKYSGAMKMFEFGTYMGRTTYHLAHNNPDGQVFSLNLPPEHDPRYAKYLGVLFKGSVEEKRITQIHIDSREFDTSSYISQFDFVFVDGDHSYEMVKNDTQKAFELLKPGGIIIWHDYAPKSEGLVRFFREFTQDCQLFRIRSTCLLVYIDGIDVMKHELAKLPESLELEYRDNNSYIAESLYHS